MVTKNFNMIFVLYGTFWSLQWSTPNVKCQTYTHPSLGNKEKCKEIHPILNFASYNFEHRVSDT